MNERYTQKLVMYIYIILAERNIMVLELTSMHVLTQGTGLILLFT